MSYSSVSSKEHDQEFCPYARALKLLEYVAHAWFYPADKQIAHSIRGPSPEHPDVSKLQAIYFDKFGNIVADLWECCYHASRDVPASQGSQDGHWIAQPLPFRTRVGLHGPGKIIENTEGDSLYLVDAVDQLQTIADRKRFELEVPLFTHGNPKLSAERELYIRPAQKHSDPTLLLSTGFTDREKRVALQLSAIVASLSPTEMRALGTHHSYASTLRDLNFELKKIIKACEMETNEEASHRLLLSATNEVARKSFGNRHAYERARTKALENSSVLQFLSDSVKMFYQPSSAIWDNQSIQVFVKEAAVMEGLAHIICGKSGGSHSADVVAAAERALRVDQLKANPKNAKTHMLKVCRQIFGANEPTELTLEKL